MCVFFSHQHNELKIFFFCFDFQTRKNVTHTHIHNQIVIKKMTKTNVIYLKLNQQQQQQRIKSNQIFAKFFILSFFFGLPYNTRAILNRKFNEKKAKISIELNFCD